MPTKPLPERYLWLPGRNVYRNAETGRFVSWDTVRRDLDSYISAKNTQLDSLTRSLQQGRISLPEWQSQMRTTLKDMHANAAMVARGGRNQMTPADWGKVGAQLKAQYKRLDQFAMDIFTGKQRLDGRMLRRAQMYGEAVRSTHQEMRRRMMAQLGREMLERRILGIAEHCPDCLDYAARGWQPLGTLPPIGESQCLTHCRCHFEFREVGQRERP